MEKQKTILRTVTLKGVGIHTGNKVNITFKPAAADSGITFIRTDISPAPKIKAHVRALFLHL